MDILYFVIIFVFTCPFQCEDYFFESPKRDNGHPCLFSKSDRCVSNITILFNNVYFYAFDELSISVYHNCE